MAVVRREPPAAGGGVAGAAATFFTGAGAGVGAGAGGGGAAVAATDFGITGAINLSKVGAIFFEFDRGSPLEWKRVTWIGLLQR